MNIASEPLPEAIAAGDEREVQLSPFGDFPGVLEGQRVMQHCDQAAFERIVANFAGEVLVDFEHRAELGGSTEAAAWVQSLRIDPAKGLMATFRFTDKGAEAVANRRLRFLSPVWLLDSEGRPEQLISVGLTNKPNLPVRPLLNRAGEEVPNVEEKDTPMKEQLIALLGLQPEASDELIVQRVQAIVEKLGEMQEEALNAEAEACASENKDKLCNKEAFKRLYVQNKQLALDLLACVKAPKAPEPEPKPVCNKAEAKTPTEAPAFAACRTPEERCAAIERGMISC